MAAIYIIATFKSILRDYELRVLSNNASDARKQTATASWRPARNRRKKRDRDHHRTKRKKQSFVCAAVVAVHPTIAKQKHLCERVSVKSAITAAAACRCRCRRVASQRRRRQR